MDMIMERLMTLNLQECHMILAFVVGFIIGAIIMMLCFARGYANLARDVEEIEAEYEAFLEETGSTNECETESEVTVDGV